ncbi:hypothetical protein CLAFUW4_12863 [Fulvia fulva]|uniref:Uncharacterized protein n=1 Tax=Passalora fulva TaxID=5499 RepID=A0A9Q8UVH0_PASFU|nr:uncharacterized protein CLAFUR5_12729 [Fulvia fulva]KAK4611869.1 hypothetical protein CLAFUR4_12867 [Fulvia fulva]KAK4612945.1 hypothetical protein CLAFUR0_12873 [Fulvia fulva]UJO23948.1 hypothetical protein CLAFUR5_12729 [Fulvia fulva]WPV21194.1 hypothetical protein CLAFUW4_12863 [Fulvia fulva]WPV36469.1 hypothetical protein CLAFUW7_12871 [Fulvia fulva]
MDDIKVATSLLDLPAEIWSKIGKLAVDVSKPITSGDFFTHPPRYFQPPITRTCRVLREELLPYFFSTRTVIWFPTYSVVKLGNWLRALDPEMRRAISGICTEALPRSVQLLEYQLEEAWRVSLSLVLLEEAEGPWRKYVVRFR